MMASGEWSTQDGSHSLRQDNGDYGIPRETFEISEPIFRYEAAQVQWWNIWSRWTRSSTGFETEDHQDAHGEADGLLYGADDSVVEIVTRSRKNPRALLGVYGLNTVLSILLFLIILNLLFGFATFLQSPGQPDPFDGWGKPGTTSEGLSWYPTDFLRDVIPIPCHSHNDYWRKVPLFSALYSGCISVEADVWAFDGELYIGHNTASLTVNRTFQSLYINPLVTILKRQNPTTSFYNGSSHGVFDTDAEQSLTLLVDVKTDGAETWPLVLQQLEPLRTRGWLTYTENDIVHRGPIIVVGTGETDFDVLTSNKTYRDAFFDAPLDQMWQGVLPNGGEPVQPGVDNIGEVEAPEANIMAYRSTKILPRGSPTLATGRSRRRGQGSAGTSPTDSYTPANSYYASASFDETIGTIWWGRLSNSQLDLIRGHIRGAHLRGLKARYWDTPSWPLSIRNYVWDVLVQEGADVLNVDDLEAVRKGVW